MADPLSITASVIAVADLAIKSCRTLKNTISSLVNAPKTLQELRQDLGALQAILQSLTDALDGVPNSALSANQKTCLEDLNPAMQGCQSACDDFCQKLAKIASHSDANHVNWFDRARLLFNEKDVELLKARLGDYKQTLNVALGVATLKTVSQNRNNLQQLETRIASSMSGFSGQIHGLEVAVRALSISGVSISKEDITSVVAVLNEHDRMLQQCLKVCASALSETTSMSGTRIKYAEVFDEAKQVSGIIGNVAAGTPRAVIDVMKAHGKSAQMGGTIEGSVALEFMRLNKDTSRSESK